MYELRRMGEEYAKADASARTAALDRVSDYVKTVLTADERASLKGWLTFLLNPPAGGDAAAKLLRNDFQPLAGFLKQLLTFVQPVASPRPMPARPPLRRPGAAHRARRAGLRRAAPGRRPGHPAAVRPRRR